MLWHVRRERRLTELKSEFISNVSHELKTPLSIISMFGEMLADGPHQERRSRRPSTPRSSGARACASRRLIDNVLDFAKIERGVDVYEFADGRPRRGRRARGRAVSRHRLRARRDDADAELEPTTCRRCGSTRNAFTLAVLNLIDNAIKYAADGKKIEVAAAARRATGVVLAVRDCGPGHRPRRARADLRALLPGARGAPQADPRLGHRPRAGPAHRRARTAATSAVESERAAAGSTFRIWIPIDR